MTSPNQHAGIDRPGIRSFCEPLWLPGWSERSIWGYDEPSGSYFAQLWPNGDNGDAPEIWITGSSAIGDLGQLVSLVASATVTNRHEVLAVLAPPDQGHSVVRDL